MRKDNFILITDDLGKRKLINKNVIKSIELISDIEPTFPEDKPKFVNKLEVRYIDSDFPDYFYYNNTDKVNQDFEDLIMELI